MLSLLFELDLCQSDSALTSFGCTDPLAGNFNNLAIENDGSCLYEIVQVNSGVLQRMDPAVVWTPYQHTPGWGASAASCRKSNPTTDQLVG